MLSAKLLGLSGERYGIRAQILNTVLVARASRCRSTHRCFGLQIDSREGARASELTALTWRGTCLTQQLQQLACCTGPSSVWVSQ